MWGIPKKSMPIEHDGSNVSILVCNENNLNGVLGVIPVLEVR